jgi:hypothetical protein
MKYIVPICISFWLGYGLFSISSLPDEVVKRVEFKSYRDTIIFGDNVEFKCVKCGWINEQSVYVKIRVPNCK